MPRAYSITFENVAVTAAQDLVQLKGAAGKVCRVKRVSVGAANSTLVTAQSITTRCRFLPATVTDGSGGTSATPQPLDPGDAAAGVTAKVNNTTKATTSGTASVLLERGDHIFSGVDFSFVSPPVVGPGESLVFELLSTVTGTVNLSGQMDVEEIGG